MKYFLAILVSTFLIGCNPNTSTEATKPDAVEAPDSKKQLKETETGRYQFLTFNGAEVLSKTTTYTFTEANGKSVSIQVSNNPEHAKIKVPPSLKEKSMVGKKVEWIYKPKTDIVAEIKIIE